MKNLGRLEAVGHGDGHPASAVTSSLMKVPCLDFCVSSLKPHGRGACTEVTTERWPACPEQGGVSYPSRAWGEEKLPLTRDTSGKSAFVVGSHSRLGRLAEGELSNAHGCPCLLASRIILITLDRDDDVGCKPFSAVSTFFM